MKIKAAVMHDPRQALAIETLELEAPRAGEVLIELKASGICHSDLTFLDGHGPDFAMPIVLGHEGAGVVLACGPGVEELAPGDHVLPLSLGECGICVSCRSRRTNLCRTALSAMVGQGALDGSTRLRLGETPVYQMAGIGSFATHAVVAAMKTVKIRADAPLASACLISCGVTTGVGAALFAGAVRAGETVAVFGLGGVGLNVVQGARMAGAGRIIGIDTNPAREAVGRRFGLTDFIDANLPGGAVAAIRDCTDGGVDVAFEAVGHPAVVDQAIAATQAGWGRTIMLGVPDGQSLQLDQFQLLAGRSLQGAMAGGAYALRDTPRIVDWAMDGRIDLDGLITHRLPLQQINEGIALLRAGEAIRVVLDLV